MHPNSGPMIGSDPELLLNQLLPELRPSALAPRLGAERADERRRR